MQDLDHNEDRLRGTYDFPFEFHHIDQAHPRYVISYDIKERPSIPDDRFAHCNLI